MNNLFTVNLCGKPILEKDVMFTEEDLLNSLTKISNLHNDYEDIAIMYKGISKDLMDLAKGAEEVINKMDNNVLCLNLFSDYYKAVIHSNVFAGYEYEEERSLER